MKRAISISSSGPHKSVFLLTTSLLMHSRIHHLCIGQGSLKILALLQHIRQLGRLSKMI
jgi:hypothetical protein